MAMKLTWCPDLAAESNLRRLGVVFEVGKVPFSKLDLKESRVNGARLFDPMRADLISDYRQGMLNGDVFPMCVVHPDKKGQWVILSGVQRTAAVEHLIKEGKLSKDPLIEVYQLEPLDKLMREVVARSSNTMHGSRSDAKERLAHAIYCVRGLGMTHEDAAKTFCVARTTIQLHVRAEKERDELMKAGVDALSLPVKTLEELRKIPFDVNAKKQVAILAAQHNVSVDRIRGVVVNLKNAKTQQERTAQVKELEKDITAEARATAKPSTGNVSSKVPGRPRRDKVLRLCEQLVKFLEHGNESESFTTLEQLQFVGDADIARLKTLVGKLTLRWNVLKVQ